MKLKVLIADDDGLIRDGLKLIFDLDDRFETVAAVCDGLTAYEKCRKEEVDVALLDIRMPVLNGVEATLKIVSETATKVMLLTMFDEDEFIKRAFRNGASGYLLKNNSADQIKNAVLSISGGNMVVQDIVMDQMTKKDDPGNIPDRFSGLTPREIEVVELIVEGLTNREIAGRLFITEGTVKNTVSNILGKLELKHRTQIVIHYLKE